MSRRLPGLILLGCGVALGACNNGGGAADSGSAPDAGSTPDSEVPAGDSGPGDSGARPDAGPAPLRAECDNINPMSCLMPWPSSHFERADPGTPTGRRLALPITAMPKNRAGTSVAVEQFNRWDGFTPGSYMVTAFEGVLDESNLPGPANPGGIDANSPTVLLDATTMQRVPHLTELDRNNGFILGRAPFYIKPLARLKENHHYVVAIRSLRFATGIPVPPSAGFLALRDNMPTTVPGIEGRRATFETDVFAPLTAAGVERASLIQAWDFHTGSEERGYGDLLKMRDLAMAAVGTGTTCTITSMEEPSMASSPYIYRRIEGTIRVPQFMDSVFAGSRLVRDAQGQPQINPAMPWTEIEFLAVISRNAAADALAGTPRGALVAYGHGLFGGKGEMGNRVITHTLDDVHAVGIAVDWQGMASDDVATALMALGELSLMSTFIDRIPQGIVNFMTATRNLGGACRMDPAFLVPGPGGTSVPAISATERYYYGNSQGGIFGGTLAGVSTDITHFVLGVGSANYSMTLTRSTNWNGYAVPFNAAYADPMERAVMMSAWQHEWDRADPAVFVPRTVSNPLPGTPAKRILMQVGVNDAQVTTMIAGSQARTYGIPLLSSSVAPPGDAVTTYGLTATDGNVPSAFVVYDVGAPMIPREMRTPVDDVRGTQEVTAHEGVRRDPRGRMQIQRFLRPDGVVENTCGTRCTPVPVIDR